MFSLLSRRAFGTSATRFLNDPILEKLGIRNKNLLRNLRFKLFFLFLNPNFPSQCARAL